MPEAPIARVSVAMKFIFPNLLFLLLSGQPSTAASQQDFRSALIKTTMGYLFVCNEPNNWYTIEINGTDVRQTSAAPKTFSVDGMFLQIVTANTGKFLREQEKRTLDERTILEAHRDWEANYSAGSYKEKLAIESSWQKLDNGKEALLWKFNVPQKTKSNLKKEIYLTVVKGDYVLMLGGIVTEDIKEDASTRLLLTTAASLKSDSKPIDLNQLKESIRKGK